MSAQGLRQVERSIKSAAEPLIDSVPGRQDLERVDQQVRTFVADRPFLAVLLALTTGYVVGRIISRVA
jgi:hypothetical protein